MVMEISTRNQYIIGTIIVVALTVVGGVLYRQGAHKPGFNPQATSTEPATTTTFLSPTTMVVSGPSGSYTITQLSASDQPTAPAYKGTITCPSSMPQETCSAIESKDATIIAMLDKNATDFSAWIELSAIHKQVGDNAGAEAMWTYLTKVYPTSPVAFNDLGDLYMNFMKEYSKAEANWLQAIKLQPNDPAPYANLFALYTETNYHPSATAGEAILKEGIAANPKAVELQVLLARYYKAQGDSAQANAEYDAAIKNAQGQGLSSLAQQLAAEKAGQ